MLWHVRISLKQKMGVFAIFSLTFITMVFSIVRAVLSMRGPREDDVIFFLCACFELTICEFTPPQICPFPVPARRSPRRKFRVRLTYLRSISAQAIIMACIVSYRAFFIERKRHVARSPAAMPLKQYGRSDPHNHSRSEMSDAHKSSGAEPVDSWIMHEGEGVEALPRDMIGVKGDILIHCRHDKVTHGVV